MKKSEEMRLKSTINESTLSTAERSPFPDGEGKEEAASPHLLEDRLKCVVYESTLSTADAVPLPQWGRQRNGDTAIPISSKRIQDMWGKQYRWTKPSPRGEGGERSEPDRVLAV